MIALDCVVLLVAAVWFSILLSYACDRLRGIERALKGKDK